MALLFAIETYNCLFLLGFLAGSPKHAFHHALIFFSFFNPVVQDMLPVRPFGILEFQRDFSSHINSQRNASKLREACKPPVRKLTLSFIHPTSISCGLTIGQVSLPGSRHKVRMM